MLDVQENQETVCNNLEKRAARTAVAKLSSLYTFQTNSSNSWLCDRKGPSKLHEGKMPTTQSKNM